MSESLLQPDERNQVLAHFLAELEGAMDRERVIESFSARYPDRVQEFREIVELGRILDQSAESVDVSLPARLGDFRILRQIDRGGMGIVCEAIQEPLDRRVVVKIIRHGRTSPESRERFLREQRVLASLHQTHIVPVFAAGEEGPIQYFAMPFIDGVNLFRLIGTARERGSSLTGDKMPQIEDLVETAKASGSTSDTDRRQIPPPSGDPAAVPRDQHAGDSDTPTLPAQSSDEKYVPPRPLSLSSDYFCSVARIMSDVAESVHHAHEHGYVHRDLKPSNIMVDPAGQSWLIDFGLAGHVNGHQARVADTDGARPTGHPMQTAGHVGTPGYMAPEQEAGQLSGVWTDVWGLGVTLYELSTLHRAYPRGLEAQGADSDRLHRRLPPRELIKDYPRDLEAICNRALRLDPADRYATAQAFADDLQRWLRGEPTVARPARVPRRVLLWARRNKAWAVAIAVAVSFVLVTATAAVAVAELQASAERRNREIVEERAVSERREREIAEGMARVLEVQAAISEAHRNGWAKGVLNQIGNAGNALNGAGKVELSGRLRSLAASVLTGLDVRRRQSFTDFSGQYVVFDPSGQRLLIGAVADKGRHLLPARIWNLETATLDDLSAGTDGPVGFRSNGTPVQLQLDSAKSQWVLLDLGSGEGLMRGDIPSQADLGSRTELAMTADGTRIAVGGKTTDGKTAVWIWDGVSGELVHSIVAEVDVLAFTPDGAWLAGGGEDGTVRIWSVAAREEACTLRASNSPITCLAFAVNRTVRDEAAASAGLESWLLAAGDADGGASLWDLLDRVPRAFCRGSQYQLFSLTFSPDGMLLASAGRGETRLWNVASGRMLLTIPEGDYISGLAFSPDGRTLATSTHPLVADPYVTLWDLDFGGAGRKYAGLDGQVGRVAFSADGRHLAGLAHNWRIAVWDVREETLERVFVAPRGLFTDNAALAFSRDGRQLAFSTMGDARLWDITSGRQLGKWQLPEGLVDMLAFDARGRLISLRTETRDGKLPPLGNVHPAQHPRVCRIRELAAGEAPKTVAEITAFNWHVFSAAIAPDASYVVIDGLGGPGGRQRLLKVFDPQGKELFDIHHDYPPEAASGELNIDPTGRHLAARTDLNPQVTLLEMPSGKFLGRLAAMAAAQSPQTRYWVRKGDARGYDRGMWLYEREGTAPRIGLGLDVPVTSMRSEFDSTGRYFAWGSEDGSVTVCDLKRLWEQLAQIDSK